MLLVAFTQRVLKFDVSYRPCAVHFIRICSVWRQFLVGCVAFVHVSLRLLVVPFVRHSRRFFMCALICLYAKFFFFKSFSLAFLFFNCSISFNQLALFGILDTISMFNLFTMSNLFTMFNLFTLLMMLLMNNVSSFSW